MLKTVTNFLLHYRILNPLYKFIMANISFIPELNKIKRATPIVVSLSSEEDDFDNLQYVLYSLFNQKIAPDKVVLWISDRYELSELPYSITKFIKSGLDIRFVDDAGSYTKVIYALREFNDSIIVTADEKIYYPKNWLLKLYYSYISNPQDIHVHNAVKVLCDRDKIHSVKEWKLYANQETALFKYYPAEAGGVLYPPFCFTKDILRKDIYRKKANVSWELWAWVMSAVSERKTRIVKNHIKNFATVSLFRSYKTYSNILNNPVQTDQKLKTLLEYYGRNVYSNLNHE